MNINPVISMSVVLEKDRLKLQVVLWTQFALEVIPISTLHPTPTYLRS